MGKLERKADDPGVAAIHVVPAVPAVAGAAEQTETHPGLGYEYTGQ